MGNLSIMTAGAVALLLVALADASVSDLRRRRIPDRDSLLIVVAFALLAPRWGLTGAGWHLAAGMVMFAVGALLFARRVWGGGDVKLCAALALVIGFSGLPRFLLVMALAGGVVAVLTLVAGRMRPGGRHAGHVPYGLAIAAGGVDWVLLSLARMAG